MQKKIQLLWYQTPLAIGVFYMFLFFLFFFCIISSIMIFIDRGGTNATPSPIRFRTVNKSSTIDSIIRGSSLASASTNTSNSGTVTITADDLSVVSGVVGASGPGATRAWLIGAVGEPISAGNMVKMLNNGYLYKMNSPFAYTLDNFQTVTRLNPNGQNYSANSFQNAVYDSRTGLIFQVVPARSDNAQHGYSIIRSKANSSVAQSVAASGDFTQDDSDSLLAFLNNSNQWTIMAVNKCSIDDDNMIIVALAVPNPLGTPGSFTVLGGSYNFRTSVTTTLPDGSQQTVVGSHPDASRNLFFGYYSTQKTYSSSVPITCAAIIPTSDPYSFALITVEDQVYLDWIQVIGDDQQILMLSQRNVRSKPRVSLGSAKMGAAALAARSMTVLPISSNHAEVIFVNGSSVYSVTLALDPGSYSVTLLKPQILSSSLPSSTDSATAITAAAFQNDQWVIALSNVNTQNLYLLTLQYNQSSGRKSNISSLQLIASTVRAGLLAMTHTSDSLYQWIIYGSATDSTIYLRKLHFGQSFLGIGNEASLVASSTLSNQSVDILVPDAKSSDNQRFMMITASHYVTLHDAQPSLATGLLGIAQQTTTEYTDTIAVATVGQISTIHSNLSIGAPFYLDDTNSVISTTSNNRGRIGIALSSTELLLTCLF